MHKGKGKMKSPATHPFPAPNPGGELGTGIDFASQPTEKVSGHNIYPAPDKGDYGGQGKKSKVVSPSKPATRVKVDE